MTLGDLATEQVKVLIPPGTLSPGTVVTVTNLEAAPPMDSSMGTPVGAPVSISVGDEPVRLNELITVTLKFDPGKLSSGTDPTTLWATFYDTGSKRWELFQPDQVDVKAGTLTFTTGHLTGFGIVNVSVDEYIEKHVHSKTVANVVQEKVVNKVVDQLSEKAVDHLLKHGLGLEDDSTKSKVYSSLLKDNEWGEIVTKGASVVGAGKDASAEDVVDLTQTINVFVGKKMIENIPEGQLADALTKLSPDKWAKYKEGGASQGYENAVSWAKSGSVAAGYLAEKRYTDAARVIGEQIADGVPLVMAVKASAEVIDYGITKWKNAEVEAAYKAYKNGASVKGGNSTFGFGSKYEVNKGAFDDVWNQMVSVDTWIQGQAIKAEEDARAEDSSYGKLPLTEAERTRISEKARADLKADFEERARREADIEKVQADLKDLLDKAKALDMLGGASSLRYSPDTLETRVKTILSARAMIVRDTWGLKGKKVTNQDIAELAKWFLTGNTQAEGRQLYWKELKRRFGIDLAAAAAPTPKATPATATGMWVLVDVSQTSTGTGSVTRDKNTATASVNLSSYAKSAWTCSWPEPPAELAPGQAWAGIASVRDMGSSRTNDELWVSGSVGYSLTPADTTFTEAGGLAGFLPKSGIGSQEGLEPIVTTSEIRFKWVIPKAPVQQMTITVTCGARISDPNGNLPSVGGSLTLVYKYELRGAAPTPTPAAKPTASPAAKTTVAPTATPTAKRP